LRKSESALSAGGEKVTVREKQAALRLIDFVMIGDKKSVSAMLNDGLDPSWVVRPPGYGKTCALREAIHAEQFNIAKTLISKGADINFTDENGINIVSSALRVEAKRLEDESKRGALLNLIKQLLDAGAKPSPDCLISAAGSADLETVQLLLSRGVNPNDAKTSDSRLGKIFLPNGETALARAVDFGHEQIVLELLRAGANPNVDISLGGRCINFAVAKNRLEIVKALIAAGANLEHQSSVIIGELRSGRVGSGGKTGNIIFHTPSEARAATPLIIAARCRNFEMVRLLVSRGANIDGKDGEGLTALEWAKRSGWNELVQFLQHGGATTSEVGGNPLHRLYNASASGNLEEIREALNLGANINESIERRGTCFTSLMRAARTGRCNVINFLLEAGADPNLGGRENIVTNITPLMLAARAGHKNAVKSLLKAGAKADARSSFIFKPRDGEDAVQQAKSKGHFEIVSLIRAAAKVKRTRPKK
jgi:serine/threonine-protein phosphatase 6 regulatory ankyrin repeat subunit B